MTDSKKRSPKSKEGGRIYNKKIIQIFINCFSIKDIHTRVKTYCLLNRLINKPTTGYVYNVPPHTQREYQVNRLRDKLL